MRFFAALAMLAASAALPASGQAQSVPGKCVHSMAWDGTACGCNDKQCLCAHCGGNAGCLSGCKGVSSPQSAPMPTPVMGGSAGSGLGSALGGMIGSALGSSLFSAKPAPMPTTPAAGNPDPKVVALGLKVSPDSAMPGQSVALTATLDIEDMAGTGQPFSKAGHGVTFTASPPETVDIVPASAVTDASGVAVARATVAGGSTSKTAITAASEGFRDSRMLAVEYGPMRNLRACQTYKPPCPLPLSVDRAAGIRKNEKVHYGKKYKRGAKGEGGSIDCSGLVSAGDPSYWSQAGDTPCVFDSCSKGTEQQLSLLENTGQENLTDPSDLRPGDVAFFTDGGQIEHVVSIVGSPTTLDNGKIQLTIASASSAAGGAGERTLTLTPDSETGSYYYTYKDPVPGCPDCRGRQDFYEAGTPK